MNHIILGSKMAGGVVLDVGELVRQFHQIPDQRNRRGGRYPLPFTLAVIVIAKLSGQNKPLGIAVWLELTLDRGPASKLVEWTQDYWSIENGLQY